MAKKELKTEQDLKKLLEDTRKMKREIKIIYNPSKNVIQFIRIRIYKNWS